jgi:hypothetical protein
MAKKSNTKNLSPGSKTPVSGQYERVGPRGGKTGAEITSTKGHPLPPAGKGERYNLVDKTKHKRS